MESVVSAVNVTRIAALYKYNTHTMTFTLHHVSFSRLSSVYLQHICTVTCAAVALPLQADHEGHALVTLGGVLKRAHFEVVTLA